MMSHAELNPLYISDRLFEQLLDESRKYINPIGYVDSPRKTRTFSVGFWKHFVNKVVEAQTDGGRDPENRI